MSRADRDGQRLRGFRCRQHMAASIENSSRLNYQTRRVDLPSHDSLGLNFHSALGKNHAVKFAGDHHVFPFDLAFDPRSLSQCQTVGRQQISLHLSVNAKHPGRLEHPFKAHTFVKEPCKFPALGALVTTFGSPCHTIPPNVQRLFSKISNPNLYAIERESLISASVPGEPLPGSEGDSQL